MFLQHGRHQPVCGLHLHGQRCQSRAQRLLLVLAVLLGALQELDNSSAGLLDHICSMLYPSLHTGSNNSSESTLTRLSRHQPSLQPHPAEQTGSSIWSVCSLTGLAASSACQITHQDLATLDCSLCCFIGR